jgi:alpha-glucuronidase
VINTFFYDKCHSGDEHGRVGNHPWRIEAEDMELDGYEVVEMHPKELASGGKYVAPKSAVGGSIKKVLDVEPGSYDIAINYFDHLGGNSKYEVFLNDTSIGKWSADLSDIFLHDKCRSVDSDSAARTTFHDVQVSRGDILKVYGAPDGEETAALDYISVLPAGKWD